MEMQGLAARTQKAYVQELDKLAKHFGCSPALVSRRKPTPCETLSSWGAIVQQSAANIEVSVAAERQP